MDELIYIQDEYWIAIYLNNKLIYEDHNIHPLEVISLLNKYKLNSSKLIVKTIYHIEENNYPFEFIDLKLKQDDLVSYNINNSIINPNPNQTSLFGKES